MDIGIQTAAQQGIQNPLPISWLGRTDMPTSLPASAEIPGLTNTQTVNLLAQIGYNLSEWDYLKIGADNRLGRYQFTPATLESYGILAPGSLAAYGTDCVNYRTCWSPVTIRNTTNGYANYVYDADSINTFLNHTSGQDHLAYQVLYDLYNALLHNTGIHTTDAADVLAGMINVAWTLGAGSASSAANITGTGAYAWRYNNVGLGVVAYNSGRYAVTVLSQ